MRGWFAGEPEKEDETAVGGGLVGRFLSFRKRGSCVFGFGRETKR